jgi:hypothetical protein
MCMLVYKMNSCPYCTLDFVDSFALFEHVFAHNIEWIQSIREERFRYHDTLNMREERFNRFNSMVSVDGNFKST